MFSYLQLKDLNHDNIKPFIGASVETGHICYLMQCCSRGNLQVCLKSVRDWHCVWCENMASNIITLFMQTLICHLFDC